MLTCPPSRRGQGSGSVLDASDGAGPRGLCRGEATWGQCGSRQGGLWAPAQLPAPAPWPQLRGLSCRPPSLPARGPAGRRLSLGSLGVLPPVLAALPSGRWAQGRRRSAHALGGRAAAQIASPSLCPAFLALACSPKFLPCWRQDVLWAQVHSSGIHARPACPSLSRGPAGPGARPGRSPGRRLGGRDSGGEAPGPQAVNPKPRGPAGTPPSGPGKGEGAPAWKLSQRAGA